jgi:hypothetical protein
VAGARIDLVVEMTSLAEAAQAWPEDVAAG